MATPSGWYVQAVEPKDCFDSCTLTVEQWLAGLGPEGSGARCEGWRDLMMAVEAVVSHSLWEWQLRCTPRVAYDVEYDRPFFIFKIDNNGTTFLVADFKREPSLEEL